MTQDMSRLTGRLLIVDDDEGVRRAFAGILRLHGHDVRAASTADDGLRELAAFRPDAILLDLRMPLVNGFGFLYRLRSDPMYQDLPVAMVTGDCSLDNRLLDELSELGAELRYKPLWGEELFALVAFLLSRRLSDTHAGKLPLRSDLATSA